MCIQFIPFLVNSLATIMALYLSMLPSESFLVLKTHLHPMVLTLLGKSTRSQTSLLFIEFISSFMALYHNSDSLEFMACEKDLGSFSTPKSDSCKYTTKSLEVANFLSLVYLLNVAPIFFCELCYSIISGIT